jgi:penicillin-binding protein 1C
VTEKGVLSAAAIWQTFETLTALRRSTQEGLWQVFSSSKKIAWKTGTSYGFRDAWAVGVTGGYVVVVWTGNADGEGRPGLIGLHAAAPLMFDIFSLLPPTTWFEAPFDELVPVAVCHESGYRATPLCPHPDTLLVPRSCLQTPACPWHRQVHLNKSGRYRVSSRCYKVSDMLTCSWFVLPPAMEWYYKRSNPSYRTLPPWLPACREEEPRTMEMIYPRETRQIFIPRNLDGTLSSTVFEVAHRGSGHTIFWHLDGTYLGSTTGLHKMELQPAPGEHTLTLIDDDGNILVKRFEVTGNRD